jgi:glyoxylase-like metal-dependent hydrolase (beta-lactamase superfamily II)
MPSQNSTAQKNEIDNISSAPKVKLSIFRSGELEVKLSGTINLKDDRIKGIQDAKISVTIYLYLIQHPVFGNILVDTGCSQEYINNEFGPMNGILMGQVMSKTTITSEETTNSIIGKANMSPEEIKAVYFTHLHFDHTSGVKALSKTTAFFIGKGEQPVSIPLIVNPNHFSSGTCFYEMDFSQEYAVDTEMGKAIDIFGDGSFWAVSTPGHSKGHVSYLVNKAEEVFFLAGDAIISNKTVETGVGPGSFSIDVGLAQKTVDRLLAYFKQHQNISILPGHDIY